MTFLNDAQVASALKKNATDPVSVALAPLLRDLFGAPAGTGYTGDMLEFVAEYQVSVGLGADGAVGRHTRLALERQGYLDGEPCAALWAGAGEADGGLAHYTALCQKAGIVPSASRPALLGLRGVYPFARRSHRMIHARRYDDAYVLLLPGVAPTVFRGATHAYQRDAADAPDVGGDSRKDVGSIRPGTYVLHFIDGDEPPRFQVTTAAGKAEIPAFRDVDHDGMVSAAEAERAALATAGPQVAPGIGMFATGILFHPGYDSLQPKNGQPFSSIGCQTAPRADVLRLRDAGRTMDYALANAAALVRADAMPAPSSLV